MRDKAEHLIIAGILSLVVFTGFLFATSEIERDEYDELARILANDPLIQPLISKALQDDGVISDYELLVIDIDYHALNSDIKIKQVKQQLSPHTVEKGKL